jgi:hypothetical protein
MVVAAVFVDRHHRSMVAKKWTRKTKTKTKTKKKRVGGEASVLVVMRILASSVSCWPPADFASVVQAG